MSYFFGVQRRDWAGQGEKHERFLRGRLHVRGHRLVELDFLINIQVNQRLPFIIFLLHSRVLALILVLILDACLRLRLFVSRPLLVFAGRDHRRGRFFLGTQRVALSEVRFLRSLPQMTQLINFIFDRTLVRQYVLVLFNLKQLSFDQLGLQVFHYL